MVAENTMAFSTKTGKVGKVNSLLCDNIEKFNVLKNMHKWEIKIIYTPKYKHVFFK